RAGALTAATANTVSRRERRTGNRCDTFIKSGAAKLRTLMRASFNRRKKARRRICRRALDVVRRAALSRGGWSDRGEDFVESLAGTERGGGLGGVGAVVAADVVGAALHGDQLGDDVGLGGGEFLGDGSEHGLELGVVGLRGEGLGPVKREVEMRAAVVDAGADLAGGALVVFEELAVGGVEGVGEDFC